MRLEADADDAHLNRGQRPAAAEEWQTLDADFRIQHLSRRADRQNSTVTPTPVRPTPTEIPPAAPRR